jgi:hypothetical protein
MRRAKRDGTVTSPRDYSDRWDLPTPEIDVDEMYAERRADRSSRARSNLLPTVVVVCAFVVWVISDVVLAVTLAAVAIVAVPTLGATDLGAAYLAAYIATCLVIAPTVVAASRKAVRA